MSDPKAKLMEYGVLGVIVTILIASQTWTGLKLVEVMEFGRIDSKEERDRYAQLSELHIRNEMAANTQRTQMIEQGSRLQKLVEQNMIFYKEMDRERNRSNQEWMEYEQVRQQQSQAALELLDNMLDRLDTMVKQ